MLRLVASSCIGTMSVKLWKCFGLPAASQTLAAPSHFGYDTPRRDRGQNFWKTAEFSPWPTNRKR
jgi:hypothetical protein